MKAPPALIGHVVVMGTAVLAYKIGFSLYVIPKRLHDVIKSGGVINTLVLTPCRTNQDGSTPNGSPVYHFKTFLHRFLPAELERLL